MVSVQAKRTAKQNHLASVRRLVKEIILVNLSTESKVNERLVRWLAYLSHPSLGTTIVIALLVGSMLEKGKSIIR